MTLVGDWRVLFNNPALERLSVSDHDYYSTHGDYVPPLAKLLLEERAENERLREVLIAIVESEVYGVEIAQLALGKLPPDSAVPYEYERFRDVARERSGAVEGREESDAGD